MGKKRRRRPRRYQATARATAARLEPCERVRLLRAVRAIQAILDDVVCWLTDGD